MIVNLYNTLKQEAENIEPSTPWKKCQISEIISKQVGIGVCSTGKIIAEYKETGMMKSPKRKRNPKTLFQIQKNYAGHRR